MGTGIAGQAGDPELKLHLAAPGDFPGVVHGVGVGGEEGAHLRLALDVELAGLHAHAAGILEGFARLDAHEHFLGVGVLFLQVVAVVGGHQGHVQLPGQGHQPGAARYAPPGCRGP